MAEIKLFGIWDGETKIKDIREQFSKVTKQDDISADIDNDLRKFRIYRDYLSGHNGGVNAVDLIMSVLLYDGDDYANYYNSFITPRNPDRSPRQGFYSGISNAYYGKNVNKWASITRFKSDIIDDGTGPLSALFNMIKAEPSDVEDDKARKISWLAEQFENSSLKEQIGEESFNKLLGFFNAEDQVKVLQEAIAKANKNKMIDLFGLGMWHDDTTVKTIRDDTSKTDVKKKCDDCRSSYSRSSNRNAPGIGVFDFVMYLLGVNYIDDYQTINQNVKPLWPDKTPKGLYNTFSRLYETEKNNSFSDNATLKDIYDVFANATADGSPNSFFRNQNHKQCILSVFKNTDGFETSPQPEPLDETSLEKKIINLIREGGARQIIFTGAPGTGKTRSAKAIAEQLGEYLGDKQAFVQFHPSYDYTDFVEGIRPVQVKRGGSDVSTMEFVKLDGVFKKFCRKVVETDDEAAKEAEKNGVEYTKPLYFFIIDEINRADLSKVFGELMFCMERDKRGNNNAIQTQYHNLDTYGVEGDDVFKHGFYIPENVVVIGTMNDIDRSVESMDFALRRRFEWIEFEVNKEMLTDAFGCSDEGGMGLSKFADELAGHVDNLNKKIAEQGNSFGLNKHYFISQGQFANIPDDKKESAEEVLKYVWEYRIQSLLREYLRGEDETSISDFIKACNTEFFKSVETQSTEEATDMAAGSGENPVAQE